MVLTWKSHSREREDRDFPPVVVRGLSSKVKVQHGDSRPQKQPQCPDNRVNRLHGVSQTGKALGPSTRIFFVLVFPLLLSHIRPNFPLDAPIVFTYFQVMTRLFIYFSPLLPPDIFWKTFYKVFCRSQDKVLLKLPDWSWGNDSLDNNRRFLNAPERHKTGVKVPWRR